MKMVFITLFFILGTLYPAFAEERQGINLEEAISIATKEVPGRVLEAEFENGVYEVKVKTENGEKIKMKIGPGDGTILRKGKVVKTANEIGR